MNKDAHLIFERYQNVNEGILDRLKARGAGAVGAVKGAGNRLAATAKGTVAGMTGDVAGVQAANQQKAMGKIQGDIAKVESYRKTALSKINKLSLEIFADIAQLGINLGPIRQQAQMSFSNALSAALDKVINDMKTQAGVQPPSTAPTPTAPTTPAATGTAPAPAPAATAPAPGGAPAP